MLAGGKGWKEQHEGQIRRTGQFKRGRGAASGQLTNRGLPAVALFPKKQTNKINKKTGQAGSLQGQESDPDPSPEGKLLERILQNTILGPWGSLLTDFFPTSVGEGKGGPFLGGPAQLLGGLILLAGMYQHLCQPTQTGRSSLPSHPTPAPTHHRPCKSR